ncbi:hypothetical protein GLOTRDRAFT_126610 [Gloeophyllum trabeum ATCC 11539]|uniref:Uncharacterized protein n=1 Tax=Gloeophyllum trabeum (strain ATCC 11539 / FP-39264 / Madison 617) TaxID=670483 RepID=S7QG27_GLOTA|nr:uncharacterized protein GLOTRDRAFT_126610 [Gloeophyllum trabeum ATCC 11539]EPQ58118.1 hypothetical protein GLOTRDRAFT_126610 [Gloeophyllum trabeum ATCC 11539]
MSGPSSLKIRIPKTSDQPSSSRSGEPRVRHGKRRVVSDDEEDGGGSYTNDYNRSPPNSPHPPTKRARQNPATYDDEEQVDIEGDEVQDTRPTVPKKVKPAPADESRPRESSKRVRKRTAKVVWSSDEDFADVVGNGEMDEEDYDFEPEQRRRGSKEPRDKGKASGIARSNGIVKVKGGKKTKKEDKEIVFKDERKVSLPPAGACTKGTSTPVMRRPIGKERDDTGDTPGSPRPTTAVNTPAATTPGPSSIADSDLPSAIPQPTPTSSLPPIPKKKKLPTIKKNKPPGSSSVSTPTTTPYPKKPAEDPPKAAVAGPSATERKAVATEAGLADDGLAELLGKKKVVQEKTEFDLRNKDVYAELFKGTGGIAPRSGINRKEKELERRKELDKMREEARAKRLEEAKRSFSLTAVPEKVGRFEDMLKERKSSAAFPNLLCGKVREIWEGTKRERERKRREGSAELRR